jgi:hypothetical protein
MKGALSSAIDGVLKPLGFQRKYLTWNRAVGPLIDAVSLDVIRTRATINAGVLDPYVGEMAWGEMWGERASGMVQPHQCTIDVRVGQLMPDRKDHWWSVKEEATPAAMAESVATYVLPFLGRMHSAVEMEKHIWEREFGDKIGDYRRYPDLSTLFALVVLVQRRGDPDEAAKILAGYRDYLMWRGHWSDAVAKRYYEFARRVGLSSE